MSGIENNNNDFLKLGKKGNQINVNAFNGDGIVKNEINKSIFEKFDSDKNGKLDKQEIEVLKAFLLNSAGNDSILSKREIKHMKQFGKKRSDVKNFYAALNDMYTQQVTANNTSVKEPADPKLHEDDFSLVSEGTFEETINDPVEEPVNEPVNTDINEEISEQEDKNYQYKVNYKDTWYGIVQAKYGITDHKQTMEIVRQLKAQNNVDPKATNMPSEIMLPENITLNDGTQVSMIDINAAVDQSHYGFKTQSETGRYTITQNGETKYYAADGTELKQSYYEAKEASADKRNMSENGSGRYSYTAENGETWYFAADGTPLKKEYYERRETEYTALNSQKETIKNARAAFQQQLDEDGWAGKTADAVSILWNSDNRAVKVEEDLKTYENQINELQSAQSKGSAEFSAKFKEIFGVDYNPANVAAYEANPTDENYKKAFGTKNDIHKRVMDYNISQQQGGEVVKFSTTLAAGIAIGVATGGTGFVALGAAALGTAAASATINTTDRLTSEVGLKEGEMGDILKNATIDGASVLAGGVIGKAAGAVVKGASTASKITRAGINLTGDVVVGAGAEYAQTGQVTLGGTAMNTAFGAVGFTVESGVLKSAVKKVRGKLTTPDIPVSVEPQPVRVSKGVKGEVNNHRDFIADAEIARNADQRHLSANERKIVEEGIEDIPTPEELAQYQREHAYQPVSDEDMPVYKKHQEQVATDYADAHRIENNAVIKEQNATTASKQTIDRINDEIKGIDGSIKKLEQQIAGAKRFGKNTDKLEQQLAALKAKRVQKTTDLAAMQTTEPKSSSKRPYYRAGVDYNQKSSFTQYTKEELQHMFSSEDLSVDRFRQLSQQNYNDLRLSGKYSPEESITGSFADIEDYDININDGLYTYRNGWLWHEFNNGCKYLGVDRVSLSAKADRAMLEELDQLMLTGSYKDAAGKVHKLEGNEFTKGYYKTDSDADSWLKRHDPITFYFDETVSEEMIDAIAIVTDKYKRIPQRELPGAVDGCPWIAHEPYTTEADINALIKEAQTVNQNLVDAIKSEGSNMSTGQYNSYRKLLDDYKQYLAL